ncbi:tRNA (adenosine(37)-N6)-threonylcarbamoyltransferase complex ATPase subunit type 1 TsaE [Candidatus Saccharibacteria bacterium]|nr:tRNA (adenosine(37)-N6)-threonylcarbamoyltransferase complex ATPase subunit type 1 TsaE [Candidatus Saccharibacteria bacterium]
MRLGAVLKPHDVIELRGDLGSGKTQLVRGIAKGANSSDEVSSPSFTISKIYQTSDFEIHHYDFYRLGTELGILEEELRQSIDSSDVATIVEWLDLSEIVTDRLVIDYAATGENSRILEFIAYGQRSNQLADQIK